MEDHGYEVIGCHSGTEAIQKSLLTENRNLLEQVQQSEIKYRTLVEKANAGIFTVDPSTGGFIDINPTLIPK